MSRPRHVNPHTELEEPPSFFNPCALPTHWPAKFDVDHWEKHGRRHFWLRYSLVDGGAFCTRRSAEDGRSEFAWFMTQVEMQAAWNTYCWHFHQKCPRHRTCRRYRCNHPRLLDHHLDADADANTDDPRPADWSDDAPGPSGPFPHPCPHTPSLAPTSSPPPQPSRSTAPRPRSRSPSLVMTAPDVVRVGLAFKREPTPDEPPRRVKLEPHGERVIFKREPGTADAEHPRGIKREPGVGAVKLEPGVKVEPHGERVIFKREPGTSDAEHPRGIKREPDAGAVKLEPGVKRRRLLLFLDDNAEEEAPSPPSIPARQRATAVRFPAARSP
ncbi:hypothetical protein C8R46DRAFT_1114705, partial [Mycena filopes]